ncbi:MAG TPA: PAS domain S-box protein [Polyangiaceae bacterium]|nr:PAS domain S-box protein [Polyangiaceae bacterium]
MQAKKRETTQRERADLLSEAERLRLASEHALRDAEERSLAVSAATGVGVFESDLVSGNLRVDRQMFRIYGLAPSKDCTLARQAWLGTVVPADASLVDQALRDALESCQTRSFEFRIRRADDHQLRHIRASVSVRLDDQGRARGLLGTNLDFTEQVETQRRLNEQDHLLNETQRLAHVGSWTWEPSRDVVTWADELYNVFGLSKSSPELTFEAFAEQVAAEDRAAWKNWMLAVRDGQNPGYIEFRAMGRDGTVHFVRARGRLTRQSNGDPERVIGTIKDITERTLAEERFRLAVEASPSAMLMVDERGVLVLVNSQAEALFGYTKAELLGRQVEQLVPESLRVSHAERRRAFAKAPVQRVMARDRALFGVRRDGSQVPLKISLNPVRSAEGALVLASVSDLTAEQEHAAARERLEAQLRQAQKMEALGTLAGGIAHDFNNHLAAIVANLHVAESELEPGHRAHESLAQIAKASALAAHLVDGILSFSRGKTREPQVTAVEAIVAETSDLLRATLPASVTLSVRCADDLPRVMADSTEIHQLLLNLGTNAWQAMPNGRGEIRVSLQRELIDAATAARHPDLRPGCYLCLRVEDNGTGMDQATLERVFDPFFTTKEIGAGTGLGLSIVHGIVKSMGGAIFVTSAPGVGTTFTVYMPEADRNVPLPTRPTTPEPVPRGDGQQLLLVEDAEGLRVATKRILERQGYRVTAFAEPTLALAALRAEDRRFRVLITDQSMPDISGLELAREAHKICPELPVILTSGSLGARFSEQAEAAGVTEVLSKPFNPDSLCRAVHRLANLD